MKARDIAIAALVVLPTVLGVWLLFFQKSNGDLRSASNADVTSLSSSSSSSSSLSPSRASYASYDGGAIAQTIADREVRDELRRRILAGWAAESDESAAAAREGRAVLPPMPTGEDGKIDTKYIKDVLRADLIPMVKKCYEELRTRKPGAEGRISMTFKIVGDDKLGAIVEETNLAADAGVLADDPAFTTCVRESTMSLAFRPLPHDGEAVVPVTLVMTDHD